MRWLRVSLVPVGLLFGIGAEWVSYRPGELGEDAADLAVGWLLLACGVAAWHRRGQSRVGPLLAAAGIAWFLGSFATAAVYLHRGPVVHALLAYPTGRLSRRSGRVAVAVTYLVCAIEPLGGDPVVTLVLCVTIAVAAIDGYLGEVGPRRRARVVATGAAGALVAVLGFGAVERLAGWDADAGTLLAYEITLGAVALALLGDLLRGRWSQAAVTGLVVELGELREPGTLRDRLAHALGDSSLELGWWLGPERGYVDDAGRPFATPGAGADRAITPIESEGERVALLVHDRVALDDPALVEAVAAAARIAVDNVRAQAAVRGRVEQLAASRRRIVEAADAQRQRLERELHEGAEQRLAAVSAHVEALRRELAEPRARELLADVENQLGAARAEVTELAHGIHPATLVAGGLAAALPELVRRSPVPVEVSVEPGRFPAAVEAATYFVCAEALTNVAKYAHASSAQVELRRDAGRLLVRIVDDGVGGADPGRGSGLRGLGDRVEALGGRLRIESPPGIGTRVLAEIPAA